MYIAQVPFCSKDHKYRGKVVMLGEQKLSDVAVIMDTFQRHALPLRIIRLVTVMVSIQALSIKKELPDSQKKRIVCRALQIYTVGMQGQG